MPSPLADLRRQNSGHRALAEQRTLRLVKRARRGDREAVSLINSLLGSAGGSSFGDAARSQRTRETYALFAQWVYVAINAICSRLAAQPIVVAENTAKRGDRPKRPEGQVTKAVLGRAPARTARKMAAAPNQYEILADHDMLTLLAQPNPLQGRDEFLYFAALQLLFTGEVYLIGGQIEGAKGVLEVWPVPSSNVTPKHEGRAFSGYEVTFGGSGKLTLPPENVCRLYFPHPADLKASMAPLQAILSAARTDRHIQGSQEDAFDRGIFPNVVVTVARSRGPDGKLTDRRPVLSGSQRRQIIRAIRQVWNATAGAGDPAILDGLVESVHKLQMTPQEMDWINSGEAVKKRILQAFRVNPIVVGEVTPASKAQAVVAEQQFCSQAVNPLADKLSEALSRFICPWFDPSGRLEAWVEHAVPLDEELRLQQFTAARANQDVSRNEFRTEILGLPPIEDEQDRQRNALLETVGGVTGAISVLTAVGMGQMSGDQAVALFMQFYELDEAAARELVGDGLPLVAPAPAPGLPAPAGGNEQDEDLEDEEPDPALPDEDAEEDEAAKRRRRGAEKMFRMLCKELGASLTRADVESAHVKQQARLERRAADDLRGHFRGGAAGGGAAAPAR